MKTPTLTDTFETWFARQGFRHFNAKEFTSYFNRARNTYPPREKWENILPTLQLLEELREDWEVPIVITSSYRSPAYNKSVGGASQSQHMEFNALDFVVSAYTPVKVYKELNSWRKVGDFKGGLHAYNTFVHVDTRGHNSNW